MARPLQLSSDVDTSSVSWSDVLRTAGISSGSEIGKVIFTNDPESQFLQTYISNREGLSGAMKVFMNSEDAFLKVNSAIDDLYCLLPSKRMKLENSMPSPSDYAKNSTPDTEVLDHCPYSGLHVGLQVAAFGKFLDFMSNPVEIQIDQDQNCFRVATKLMQSMSQIYPSEDKRKEAFFMALGDYLPCSKPQTMMNSIKTDATILLNGTPVLNWEFKNDMVSITSQPIKQNIGYFIHLQKGRKDRSPMLLVSVVGCYFMQVFGAVWNKSHVCMDPLTPPLSLCFVPRDPLKSPFRLGVALHAIKVAVEDLQRYYATSIPDRNTENSGPYDVGDLSDIRKDPNICWLFEAQYYGRTVVVKYCRSYGKAVHEHLAARGFAPNLISHELLAGGWHKVVMEKTEGKSLFQLMQEQQQTERRSVKDFMRQAMEAMHAEGYVHGDLRPQNVMVLENGTVHLLDFDWAGKEGEARYPYELNTSHMCNWHKGVMPGGLIQKVHDEYQIENL